AVRRRAAAEFTFGRPGDTQRRQLLTELLSGLALQPTDIDRLVSATGSTADRPYGYAYSDLVDRLVPAAVLAAYPDRPLTADIVLEQVRRHPPTKPFTD